MLDYEQVKERVTRYFIIKAALTGGFVMYNQIASAFSAVHLRFHIPFHNMGEFCFEKQSFC